MGQEYIGIGCNRLRLNQIGWNRQQCYIIGLNMQEFGLEYAGLV